MENSIVIYFLALFQLVCDESVDRNETESFTPGTSNQETMVTNDNSNNCSVAREMNPSVATAKTPMFNINDNRNESVSINMVQDIVAGESVSYSKFTRNNSNPRLVAMETRSKTITREAGSRYRDNLDKGGESGFTRTEQRDRRQGQMSSTMKSKPVSCHQGIVVLL